MNSTRIRQHLGLATLIWLATASGASAIELEVEPFFGAAGWGHLKIAQGQADLSNPVSPLYPPLKSFDFSECLAIGLRLSAVLQDTYFASVEWTQFPKVTTTDSLAPSWTHTQLGIHAGAQLPAVPVRFWIGFNVRNSITPNSYLGIAGVSHSVGLLGTAFKMGTGIQIYAPLWINFEMIYGQFSHYSSPVIQPLPADTSTSYNYFFLSLSSPIRWLKL